MSLLVVSSLIITIACLVMLTCLNAENARFFIRGSNHAFTIIISIIPIINLIMFIGLFSTIYEQIQEHYLNKIARKVKEINNDNP